MKTVHTILTRFPQLTIFLSGATFILLGTSTVLASSYLFQIKEITTLSAVAIIFFGFALLTFGVTNILKGKIIASIKIRANKKNKIKTTTENLANANIKKVQLKNNAA